MGKDGYVSMMEIRELEGNGDFRSPECRKYLEECDVVVTNPPFSLFREFFNVLTDYKKKFIVVGHQNVITYKEIFPFIKNNELWLGCTHNGDSFPFKTPLDKNELTLFDIDCCTQYINARWFTNIEHSKRNKILDLYKKYNEKDFPKYDNYDAIECGRVSEIPMDYYGVIGVPITFLDKYNPKQFEIVDAREIGLNDRQRNKSTYLIKDADSAINGKPTYARIAIKRLS